MIIDDVSKNERRTRMRIELQMAANEDVFDEEEEDLGPHKPCEGSRKELVKCLKDSDCIKVVCHAVGVWSLATPSPPPPPLQYAGMFSWTMLWGIPAALVW